MLDESVGGDGSAEQAKTTYVALAADHLVAVELGGQSLERGLDDTTAEAEDQVEGGLLRKLSASVRSASSPHFLHRRHLHLLISLRE